MSEIVGRHLDRSLDPTRNPAKDGLLVLSVPDIKCGHCMATIEHALNHRTDVSAARVNMSLKRVSVRLEDPQAGATSIIELLDQIGFPAEPIDWHTTKDAEVRTKSSSLLKSLAVAGFGAMNIMLLSVAVWSGADGATRDTFHLISALIAIPVALYSGRPFFDSAWGSVKRLRLNMDVPISLAVILAMALSLFEMLAGNGHTFFDAAVTLLFFLLAGRYLDQLMREKASSAAANLARISADGALVLRDDGTQEFVKLAELQAGMKVHISPGERIPVDVRVVSGSTDVDRSITSGEPIPIIAEPGTELEAGALNLTGNIEAEVIRGAEQSFLAKMIAMLANAESGRARYVRLADRAAQIYAPAVHLLALVTFIGWMILTAGDWHNSIYVAISVLIITCPCALGLAVPIVQVVAAGRLLDQGILMNDGAALERLAEIDTVVFDKTGTVTDVTPSISGGPNSKQDWSVVKALAEGSSHPVSKSIQLIAEGQAAEITGLKEVPGYGVTAEFAGKRARLGRGSWVSEIAAGSTTLNGPAFAIEGEPAHTFELNEVLRPGASETVQILGQAGLHCSLLSGDAAGRVKNVAASIGMTHFQSEVTPEQKVGFLRTLGDDGHKVLMVGDGINDAPALSAAHVSMAPSTAASAGRESADFIFLRHDLRAVPTAYDIARRSSRLIIQNFGLAIIYNCIAVPLAVSGHVTPLIAAIAMSSSSLVVIGNALRLRLPTGKSLSDQAPVQTRQVPA